MSNRSDPARDLSGYRSALLVVRTFLGIVYFTNGLAKLFGFHDVTIGVWHTFLINRDDALNIQTGNTSSSPGFVHDLGTIIISNWGVFQWLLTLGELAVGLGLLLGVLSRLTAIGGFFLAFATFIFTLGAGTWTYDYLFEPVLFVALAIAPPLPGLDSRLPWGTARRSETRVV
jgi:thiosulfate dehydrogenase [quinone] large subunit